MRKRIIVALTLVIVLGILAVALYFLLGGDDEKETPPPHTHEYSTEYSFDDNEHWFECECGEKKDKTAHVINNGTCTCGYEKKEEHTHDFSTEYSFDVNEHWYECECGDKKEIEEHKPGAGATETTDQVCTVCNYVLVPALNHVHSSHLTKVDAKEQSCTKEGNIEYYQCSCGKLFTDNTATTEITDRKSVVIAKDDHNHTILKKSTLEHWYECECGDKGEKENHKGGTATETSKPICSTCNQEYGELLEKPVTEGLVFTLINNETEYEVSDFTGTSTEVIIPSTYKSKTVTSVGARAFYWCDSLQSIEIPASVTSVGARAFYWCDSLQSIEIPASVTSIGDEAFGDCDSLESVTFGENSKLISIDFRTFDDCDSLKSVTFGENSKLTSIGDEAFDDCDSLESVTFGENSQLTSIGYGAFSNCFSLKNIEIPASVTSIGEAAFYSCNSLQNIEISESVINIGELAFAYCSSLQSIAVSSNNANYKSIDGNLYSKDGKTLIQYPKGKTATSFILSNNVTSIGNSAFSWCDSLQSVTFGENSKLTSIGDYAFCGCTSLQSIEIPVSVTSMGNSAFSRCDSLQSVTFEENSKLTSISEYAFYGCDSLQSIVIQLSVTSIGDYAFAYCTSLTIIYCEVKSQPSGWDNDWNEDCPAQVIWGYKG